MRIRTNVLITLGDVLEEFEEFRRDLRVLVEKKNYNIFFIISALADDKYVLGYKDAKNFYQKYQKVIDIINRGSCPITLFLSYVAAKDNLYDLDFFYKYLVEHKSNLDKILGLLEKIKALGIETIMFTKDTFTEIRGEINSLADEFYFMENMVGLPDYTKDRYKTKGTHYVMKICIVNDYLSCREIKVNSLDFEERCLPKDLSKENTYDVVINGEFKCGFCLMM